MRVVIISKKIDGEKEAIGASASESKAKEYIREEALTNFVLETVDLPTSAKQRVDNIYLAYKPQDGTKNSILVGYFTNRFNAQQASRPGGYISRIPLVENRHKSTTRPATSNKRSSPAARATDKKSSSAESDETATVNAHKVRILAGLVTLWLIAIAVIALLSRSSQHKWGENQETVTFLPDYCRNVSYYLSDRFKVYEFSCNEDTFKRYAANQDLIVQELEAHGRAKTFRQYADMKWDVPQGLTDAEQWKLWQEIAQPIVQEGYQITGRRGFNGEVLGFYDRHQQRVYYWEKAQHNNT